MANKLAVSIDDLEDEATKLVKSLDGEDEAEKREPTPLSLVNKSLNLLASVLPAKMRKAMALEDELDEGDDNKGDDDKGGDTSLLKKEDLVKKSGERIPPHGDTDKQSGDMSGKRMRKFQYQDEVMGEDAGADDVPDNAKKNTEGYQEGKRKVHKSLDDIANDPDLTAEDKVIVINDYLQKSFGEISAMKKSIDNDISQKLDVMAMAHMATIKVLKSLLDQGNQGAGRISHLSLADKRDAGNPLTKSLDKAAILQKAQKLVKSELLQPAHIAELENAFNDGRQPRQALLNFIQQAE